MRNKILVVEDDNILAKAIFEALRRANGFKVELAVDGEEALKKMKANVPDLILLDLVLPKRTGEDVLAAMKQDEKIKDIPVLVMTVKQDKASISRCISLGARGYLIKSHYTLEEIVNKAKNILSEIGN
ncbi:MAG: response regulator [Patescibacteria group bacterium]|nr:response regulator [Patescibacteria group bacterium]